MRINPGEDRTLLDPGVAFPGCGRRAPLRRRAGGRLWRRARPARPTECGGIAGTLSWSDINNWSNNAVPTSNDDVTISKAGVGTITIGTGTYPVRSLNDTTAPLSIAPGGSLSLAAVAVTSTFGQNVTVQ